MSDPFASMTPQAKAIFGFARGLVPSHPGCAQSCELHISIGATPDTESTLERELPLVKAAILYADRVTLYSFTSYVLFAAKQLSDMDAELQVRFIEGMARYFARSEQEGEGILRAAAMYRRLKLKRLPTMAEARTMRQFEADLGKLWRQLADGIEKTSKKGGVTEVFRAIDAGVLDTYLFQSPNDSKLMAAEFFEVIERAVSDHTTYPLLDDGAATLIRQRLETGAFRPTEVAKSRGRHTALASHLLQRLPTFELATVDELLDIRRELQGPLAKFRAAMLDYSALISSAAWDEDFAGEADVIFHQKVAPAIVEIEEAIRSSHSLTSLLQSFLTKPLGLTSGSALALAATTLHASPLVAAAAGVAATVSGAALDADKERRQKRDKGESHQMYFYYRARKAFGGHGPP